MISDWWHKGSVARRTAMAVVGMVSASALFVGLFTVTAVAVVDHAVSGPASASSVKTDQRASVTDTKAGDPVAVPQSHGRGRS